MSRVQPPRESVPYAKFATMERERDQWRSRCTQVEQEKASLLIDNQDLRQTNAYLEQRDRDHLEEKAELEEENNNLHTEITTLKQQKHDASTRNQETLAHAKETEQTQTNRNQSTPTETRDTHQETGRDHREPRTHYREPEETHSSIPNDAREIETRLSRSLESTTGDAATRELILAALNCISTLKAAFTQEQEAHQETRERLRREQTTRAHKELFQQQVDEIKRGIKRLPYTKMGSSDKLVALDYVEQVAARHLNIADLSQPFHPIMEQMATRLGLSEAQLTRINQTQKKAGAWTHDVKREFKERVGKKEIYTCTVTVSLDKILSNPESIEKPEGPKGAHQGGARVRHCKDCGSDDMDRYALEYCRSCKKAHAQILPGLRSDANIHDAINAVKQDRYTIQDHVFEYSQQDQNEQKHDAFTQEEVQELNAQLESTIHQIDTQLTMQATPPTQTQAENEQKHDAFPEIPAEIEPRYPTFTQEEIQQVNALINIFNEIPTEVEQKHDAFVEQRPDQGEQPQRAEQLQAPSKMQGRSTVEESLHDALAEGTRVDTPVGLATVRVVRYFENLEIPRWRCSVHTDAVQPDGSHFAAFDVCQVQQIRQVVLL